MRTLPWHKQTPEDLAAEVRALVPDAKTDEIDDAWITCWGDEYDEDNSRPEAMANVIHKGRMARRLLIDELFAELRDRLSI